MGTDMEAELQKLKIVPGENTTPGLYLDFIDIVDVAKKKKEIYKILKDVDSDGTFFSNIEVWLCQKLISSDITILKKVSSLLELSTKTRDVLRRNFKDICAYIVNLLSLLCDEEKARNKFPNCERFNECVMITVKLCLQLIQFLPEEVSDVLLNKDADPQSKGNLELMFGSVLTILCLKRFPKECSLLAGTGIALLFNLCPRVADTISSIQSLLNYFGNSDVKKSHQFILGTIFIKFPENEPSSYSALLFINGFLTINSSLLLAESSDSELLLDSMFKQMDVKHYNDPVSKYLCFQTLLAWLNYINHIGIDQLLACYNDGRSLFLRRDSNYCCQLLDWVWKHIEDLVDGLPAFNQKIFALILKLHDAERTCKNEESSQDQFYVELAEDVLKRSWHVKGRWSMLAELVPFVTYRKAITLCPCLVDELIQCMTTCGLAAISNEVYQAILKEMKNSFGGDEDFVNKEWSSCFAKQVVNALQSDNILLRQNIGQYWIPSTVRILPDCLLITEKDMRSKLLNDEKSTINLLHAYILIMKSCRNFALIKNDRLDECKDLLSKALQHSDLDIRIETFNTLCCNPKKTEPLPISFQPLLLNFVKDNLNNDSSRFRQQMLSSLKKLLMNVRDSSVMLYRRYLNELKKGVTDGDSKHMLMKLIDFVGGFLQISKSCLHPGALFQRKKTGLLVFQLLSELFIYVEDEGKRKKGAAADSARTFFEFIGEDNHGLEIGKLAILSSMDKELLSCIEDQHDEIRDLALEILTYHQEISDDHLLNSKETFYATMDIALSLLDSAKYHETESGAMIVRFIMNRMMKNKCITRYMNNSHFNENPANCNESDYMVLCYFLLNRGKKYRSMADDDFLLAACHRPIYGILLAFSQILNSFTDVHCHPHLAAFIKNLITFCNSISLMTVQLLAGTYIGKNKQDDDNAEVSPSFADTDEALDIALRQCPSFPVMKKTVGHLHCRELLVSFCWLNLKAISFVLIGVGNLMGSFGNGELILDMETFELIYNYYKNSLIKCRHKGVIEGSLASLTLFSKNVASITSYWKEMKSWCFEVLQSAVDLTQTASVTKRSAGIPMFIQAILASEPSTENNELLHKSMKYLLEVAKTELPKDINVTVDLPQFNAINIMRAIFRDSSLGNTVLPLVEDAVMLTINGFSSHSWSIRNASTILLGTLVPRMLGQRISQEENNLNNTSTVDIFFYRYPSLVSYFKTCLDSQTSTGAGYKANYIAPHVIPALTFLSKLSSGEKYSGLSSIFLPILNHFLVSPVFTIREMTTSAILAFTPEDECVALVEDIFGQLLIEKNNNKVHSLCMLLLKTMKKSNDCKKDVCLTIIEHYKAGSLFTSMICDLLSRSVILDILLECYHTLRFEIVGTVLDHLLCNILFTHQLTEVCVGKPIFLMSLAKAVVTVLCGEQGEELLNRVIVNKCKDLHLYFFKYIKNDISSVPISLKSQIFHFTVKTILETKCRILLESSLACFKSILDVGTFSELINIHDLLNRLLELLNSSLRLLPLLLPIIEKLLNHYQYIHKYGKMENTNIQPELTHHVYSTMVDTIAGFILKYSSAEMGEDLRFAAAGSLGLLQQLILTPGRFENVTLFKRALHRTLTGAVRLLQDEDEAVRLKANFHLRFIHSLSSNLQQIETIPDFAFQDISNCHEDVQCNITLQNLLKFVERMAATDEMYFNWLVDLLVQSDPGDFIEKCDLILFEQEASNLYAEEMVIIDLVFESLKAVLTVVSNNPFDVQRFYTYSQTFKEAAHVVCKKDINWLRSKMVNSTTISSKSVYTIFGSRKSFITVYKMIKWLLILRLCITVNERNDIKELYVNEFVSILAKFSLHPLITKNYDEVRSNYHVL